MGLFLLLMVTVGALAMLGSIVGAAAGKTGLFVGGFVGGLIAAPCAALVARWLRWIGADEVKGTAIGAAVGFVAAATIAVNTLSSPVGPVLSTLLVGAGGLAGRRLGRRSAD